MELARIATSDYAAIAALQGNPAPRTTGRTSAPVPMLAPPSTDHASPAETASVLGAVGNEVEGALASGDPSVLLTLIAGKMNRTQQDTARASIDASDASRVHEQQARMESFHRAADAEGSQKTWGLLAKIGCYVAAAAAAVIGVVAAVYSGGVSVVGAVALVAALVSSAASITSMALKDGGVMKEAPPWLGVAIGVTSVVAAVCSFGAGSAGVVATVGNVVSCVAQSTGVVADAGVALHLWNEPPPAFRIAVAAVSVAGAGVSAGAAISSAARAGASVATAATVALRSTRAVSVAINAGASVVRGAGQVAQGVGTVGGAITTFEATSAHADERDHENAVERIDSGITDLLDGMRAAIQTHARTVRHAAEMAVTLHEARTSIARNFARA